MISSAMKTTSRSLVEPMSIMPAMREQHERVVLARRQVVALGGAPGQEDRQQADAAQHDIEEQREVVGDDDAESGRG